MNVNEHVKKYQSLDDWFNLPQGKRAAQAFSEELTIFQSQLKGERLLQLGHCGSSTWLPQLGYRQKWIITPCSGHTGSAASTTFNQLPFDRDSIDCIIAPFTFEALSLEKNPIDELERVLKPMGYLIFWGINPLSFWGLALKTGRLQLMGDAKTKLTSVFSVKHALLNRGFRQCVLTTFYYIPPVEGETLIHKLEFLNEMGKMLWLYPAGFYCLIVQKHEIISPPLILDPVESRFLVCPDNSLA